MAAIGWYGPLIDLGEATSHVGDYVQLLVFVHRTRPFQKFKSLKGSLLRTDIQVGDDTRLFFNVTLWKKEMGSMVIAGDVVLLQNVTIVKYGGIVEAQSVLVSSLTTLVHSHQLLASEGLNDQHAFPRVGETTKEKLKKVIMWLQHDGLLLHQAQLLTCQKRQLVKNWKVNKEMKYQECISVSLVSSLTISCKATFSASVGEIFLPLTSESDGEKDQRFIRRRLYMMEYDKIMEDLICTGCKLCGIPMNTEERNVFGQIRVSLYCQKSSSRLHTLCLIYRKFMLYVWDESECIPLLVTNNCAEILFGNITAEQVYTCYRDEKIQSSNGRNSDDGTLTHAKASEGGESSDGTPSDQEVNQQLNNIKQGERTDFYKIWVILLKMLLRHESNSPLKFTVNVNSELSQENGRFELIGMTMPCV